MRPRRTRFEAEHDSSPCSDLATILRVAFFLAGARRTYPSSYCNAFGVKNRTADWIGSQTLRKHRLKWPFYPTWSRFNEVSLFAETVACEVAGAILAIQPLTRQYNVWPSIALTYPRAFANLVIGVGGNGICID